MENIIVLSLPEAVKKRPGMYFGNPETALCNLLSDLIQIVLIEGANQVELRELKTSQLFVLSDNAPLFDHQLETTGYSFTEEVTQHLYWLKFIAAACSHFVIKTAQGFSYFQSGKLVLNQTPPINLTALPSHWKIAFIVDNGIISSQYTVNLHRLAAYCQAMCLSFNSRVKLQNSKQTILIHYPNGIQDRLEEISAFRSIASPIAYRHIKQPEGQCGIALRFAHTGKHHIELYVNEVKCVEGGRTVANFIKQLKRPNELASVILAVLKLNLEQPKWHGSLKEKLNDARGDNLIKQVIGMLFS